MPATSPASKASTRAPSYRVLIVLAIVALAIYAFDQIAKYLIVKNIREGDTVNVLGQFLQFHFVKNSGAAFSLGEGMTWVFSIVATAVAIFIIIYARRIHSYGWGILFGMLLGGTLGNLTDRLFREPRFGEGHVVDFVQVYGFPAIFNVADSAIVVSMGLFIVLTIVGIGLDGTRASKTLHALSAAQTHDAVPIEPTAADPAEAPGVEAHGVDPTSSTASK